MRRSGLLSGTGENASVCDIVGVIPAAGYATRLQPLGSSKETLLVRGRPVLDYLAERMRCGGATQLRVVTRAEKEDVIEHCSRIDAQVVLASPATVAESIAIGLRGMAPNDVVLIGFPDTVWEPIDGYRPLVELVAAGAAIALGLFRIRASDLARSDVVVVDSQLRVLGVHVKPEHPPSDVIWGCAAARAVALGGLERAEGPGAHVHRLCSKGVDVRACILSEKWLDIGTMSALEEATWL
jgi:dTDP-glucose pyrophosphorylase